jgi:hypothetical protein
MPLLRQPSPNCSSHERFHRYHKPSLSDNDNLTPAILAVMGDFFGFSSTDYRYRVSNYNNSLLLEEEEKKRTRVFGHKAGMAVSTGFAFQTGGTSLLGTAISGRKLDVESRKLKILQEVIRDRGLGRNNVGFGSYTMGALRGSAGGLAGGFGMTGGYN